MTKMSSIIMSGAPGCFSAGAIFTLSMNTISWSCPTEKM